MSSLLERAAGKCELCSQTAALEVYVIPATSLSTDERSIVICGECLTHLDNPSALDPQHWEGLQDAAWSPYPAVQAATYRILQQISAQLPWAANLMEMIYLDDAWLAAEEPAPLVHTDSNGHILQNGDSVTLIQDLNVKGATFTAKRGTAVRRIRLVQDNPEQIEGKVNEQMIVILTKYVKKMAE
ncbi:MAG TPA: PhnA domain-containing protein [Saprospiraceae bacterium]|nr:PhnA domain-containing protein [Saprospiraceae bacterium]HMQ84745.1 PhnA domain-containing protein [Saprospiraceae bacterium]